MNMIDYLRLVWRRGWIVGLLAILVGASAYVFSIGQAPTYRGTQSVLMQPSRIDLGAATRQLLGNHVAYLDSQIVASQIIDELNLDMTPAQLKNHVNIASDLNNLVIQIDVDLSDEAVAVRVAERWGMMLLRYRAEQNQTARSEDRINAGLQDFASVRVISPQPRINAIVGIVIGLFLGAMIVFTLEMIESSIIRRRDDAERVLGIPVLAAIPEA